MMPLSRRRTYCPRYGRVWGSPTRGTPTSCYPSPSREARTSSSARTGRLPNLLDEAGHRRSHPLAAASDDPDGAHEPGKLDRQGHERPHPDFLQDRRPRQDAHARVDPDGLLDGLDVVELHHDVDPHPRLLQGAVDSAADGEVGV